MKLFTCAACSILLLHFPAAAPIFEAQVVDDHVAIGYGLAIGDVDGDQRPDILLADKTQIVWYRNGDWKRFVMAENLTAHDNVCIAARDIDGDGKVEVAVGAQWNPAETTDTMQSGAVFYLQRPQDPAQKWSPVPLHHEPTVHRMKWVQVAARQFQLVMLPLHGRGNKNGLGQTVRMIAYPFPANPNGEYSYQVIDIGMHMTHNLELVPQGEQELIYVGGKEGVQLLQYTKGGWQVTPLLEGHGFGELRKGKSAMGKTFLAAVEPMHGNQLTLYPELKVAQRRVLTDQLNQGHALACADLLGKGQDQVIIGWREPNVQQKVGIQIFVPDANGNWNAYTVDDNAMACEDLQIADLNGDGKKDIIAAGRATHNLKIYWNRN